jgi:hypothetical protein
MLESTGLDLAIAEERILGDKASRQGVMETLSDLVPVKPRTPKRD